MMFEHLKGILAFSLPSGQHRGGIQSMRVAAAGGSAASTGLCSQTGARA